MELTELREKILKIFKAENITQATEKMLKVLLKNDEKILMDYIQAIDGNLEEDYMQALWQYDAADREKLNQDFTPKSLGKLMGILSESENEETCLDLCAGSGALTIQKWCAKKDIEFKCVEIDENVIPILLFNLSIRNIAGYVLNGNALNNEYKKIYKLTRGQKFSFIEEINVAPSLEADTCICNPPYNIKWEPPAFAQLDRRFNLYGVPAKTNANYAFILTGLHYAKKKTVMLMPNNVLKSSINQENVIRQALVDNNILESVIVNPGHMFVTTDISTSFIVLNKHKQSQKMTFIDMRQCCDEEVRKQKGQYGGKSHLNRTYLKTFNIYKDEHLSLIKSAVNDYKEYVNTAITLSKQEVANQHYDLTPASLMVNINFGTRISRPYIDIVTDINRIIKKRNSLKLTINENVARTIGINSIVSQKSDLTDISKLIGFKLEKDDYITFTKNKNQIEFKNNNSDEVNPLFSMLINAWRQQIITCNNEENIFLAELRDKLMEDLLNGSLEIKHEHTNNQTRT